MPSVIAIDCSLSMSRVVATADDGAVISKLQLGCICASKIIDHFSKSKLEHIAIVSISSMAKLLCDFTRNYSDLQTALNQVKTQDLCNFTAFVNYINKLVVSVWGCIEPCQVIVLTDGRISWQQKITSTLADIFNFPATLNFLCFETFANLTSSGCLELLNELIRCNSDNGFIKSLLKQNIQDKHVISSTSATVVDFLNNEFCPFTIKLRCGNLHSKMVVFPTPQSTISNSINLNDELVVVGFLNIADIGNPSVLSRHLLLPISEDTKKEFDVVGGLQPSFSVLLHGSLKVENKVALVKLADNWYGIVYSWSDSKTKSNLVLSFLSHGNDAIPWIGDIRHLGPASLFHSGELPTFPVQQKKGPKKSYAQPTVAWIRATGLQTDVQKILRSAKKLPEKSQVFYKDLNRLRRAALSFGFHELLEGISSLLERECTLLPGTAHPEATLQLSHASRELKASIGLDYNHLLEPLKTDFKFGR